MKKTIAIALMLTMLAGAAPVASMGVYAAEQAPAVTQEVTTAKTTKTVKPVRAKVEKVTCTASGKVNISFKGGVTYTEGLSVAIKDADGKTYDCKISKKNKALLVVSTKGLVKGEKYTLHVEGVKAKGAQEAAAFAKTFVAKGMKTECKVAKAEKSGKNYIILKLKGSAYYKDASVVVKDADGKELSAKIVKKAKGNIKVKAEGMKKGKAYTVTVTGVKMKKEANYASITKTFKAK